MSKPRMLTGDRPTGKFHLGHFVGTMKNRVKLQHEYECFFLIADLHMLTTKHLPEHIRETDAHARELILDAIAAGVEPEHVTFYLQSGVHEISEIYTLVQNLVTVSRLERMPSLKDMARDANIEMPFGLLGYPVLQAADAVPDLFVDLPAVGRPGQVTSEPIRGQSGEFASGVAGRGRPLQRDRGGLGGGDLRRTAGDLSVGARD